MKYAGGGVNYAEVSVGDRFGASMTLTEAHIVIAAGLFGDFNPLHVNEVFARDTVLGGRVLHGTFTGALMSAAVGRHFAGTAIAYLEQNCRFRAPARAGDTLTTEWIVTGKIDKPKFNGGIVVITAECRNQDNTLVADADGKILVGAGAQDA